jgi:hypothetical protein
MPAISMFYGIIVYLYFFDNKQHNIPQIHAEFQDEKVVVSINDLEILSGDFPKNKLRLLLAWMELHRDELLANWKLAVSGQEIFKIDPLR